VQELLPASSGEQEVIFNGDNYTEEWHAEARSAACQPPQHHRVPAGHHPQDSIDLFSKYKSTPSASCRAGSPS